MDKYLVVSLLFITACGNDNIGIDMNNSLEQAVVAGSGYSTFDATVGGCLDSPNGVDCNNYAHKSDVYTSGGPVHAGLSDGSYYFSVLTPGSQSTAFVDGADGNLSDTTVGATVGDLGLGDSWTNRVFTVVNHVASYTGTHATGTSLNGNSLVQLVPFDNTDNPGQVYILALCEVGAIRPSQCKFDAFRAPPDVACDPEVDPNCDPGGGIESVFGTVAGEKYYDANANGQLDVGEVGIVGWPIWFHDQVSDTLTTDEQGEFVVSMMADTYTFGETVAGAPWFQTGNVVSQLEVVGDATASLNPDKTYSVGLVDDSNVLGVYFGNLCIGAGGGLTLGFWSNKNGQALIGADDLAMLVSLNLRNANGSTYDPPSKTSFRTWVLNATATNMAYMLSAQMATMSLNVYNGFVSSSSLVCAPGTLSANVNGFATVGALLTEADTTLGSNGYTVASGAVRSYQEVVKNTLDNANNNRTFVQVSPATCPAPVFKQ